MEHQHLGKNKMVDAKNIIYLKYDLDDERVRYLALADEMELTQRSFDEVDFRHGG
jgi:hypothetical protein